MALKKGQMVEVEIEGMALGGKAIARVDGMVVFVDHCVTGDKADVRIVKKKKSYAEARLVALKVSSPFRIQPPCPYAGYCGGCKWQFIDYDQQLAIKRAHVRESLEHIGLLENVRVHPTISASSPLGYRNKMEFSFSDRRWLLPHEMELETLDRDFALGLHVPGTFHKVLDIDKCLLQPDLGNAILGDVARFVRKSKLPVYGLKSHEGFWRFLMLRHSVYHDQWLVNMITAYKDEEIFALAEMLVGKYPQIASVMHNVTAKKAQIAVGEYETCIYGDPVIKDRIGKYEFEISANSFFQTNSRGAERLYDIVRDYAGLTGNETVFDLYCGAGTISIFLSEYARRVTGFEIAGSAVADARKNCRENGVLNCSFVLGDIKASLSQADEKPDVMIIDPPRAGMHKDVVRQVSALAPERIVYVSCNPATLARDVGLMKDYYTMLEVRPLDMFPQTFHVESVAMLIKC